MTKRLLLAEDDAGLCALLTHSLEKDGFAVECTPDGEEALARAKMSQPDVILLDWMIEGLSGIEVCRRLRRSSETANIPIIMISGRAEEADRIRGLETGADDYVTKPFSPRELAARVWAVLRRSRPALAGEQLVVGSLVMDLSAYRVRRDGRNINLGPTEFRLLRHFMQQPGRVYAREQLLESVWGSDREIAMRTIDVHIRRLRQALAVEGRPDLIRTVRSAGYALDDDAC